MDEQTSGGTDRRILDRIGEMVAAERELRTMLAEGRIDPDSEQQRLHELEAELDQCWDLLRQRRARVDAGDDPDLAAVRSIEEVERYES
ncbi:DUF2630 family protein [Streptomyces sp. TLI_235]|uniref:DUF2630 family protein n=1 Tax=Kitasatospora sp. NPDC085879 TaxID=3154769 RepID=UPI000BDDA77B|nr:DUF2630 family protein [Streptomyces sp. TLI_235]PBC71273.1 uncharacterized protein DUF2630 [Streptomyces sp. TLI_235]